MIERRIDHVTRKRVSQMSAGEMRQILLTSETTGLPNRRAFDEAGTSPVVAMADVNGLKGINDRFGYSAGDGLIRRFAKVLVKVGLEVYHEKGDEFLCRGKSADDLREKLTKAQQLLQTHSFVVTGVDGSRITLGGADFCFGIGVNQRQAEKALKQQKQLKGGLRTDLFSYARPAAQLAHSAQL